MTTDEILLFRFTLDDEVVARYSNRTKKFFDCNEKYSNLLNILRVRMRIAQISNEPMILSEAFRDPSNDKLVVEYLKRSGGDFRPLTEPHRGVGVST